MGSAGRIANCYSDEVVLLVGVLTSIDLGDREDQAILANAESKLGSDRQVEGLRKAIRALPVLQGSGLSRGVREATILLLEKEIEVLQLRGIVLALDAKCSLR